MGKYLDSGGLGYLLGKLKAKFATKEEIEARRNLFLYTGDATYWANSFGGGSNSASYSRTTDSSFPGFDVLAIKRGSTTGGSGIYRYLIANDTADKSLVVGETYTISFWAKASTSGLNLIRHNICENQTVVSSSSSNGDSMPLATTWSRCWVTFTATSTTHATCFYATGTSSGTEYFYITKMMLNKGAVVPDWSPAPEDYAGVRTVATGTDKGTISVNTNGTVANVPVKGLEDGYINTHPENSPMLLPFIHNDIAFMLSRGGSAVVTKDGEVWNTSITNVFDGSPSYWAITSTGITEIVFELTLQQVFAWTNTIYVDFGPWWTRSVKIEVMNSNYENDVWTERFNDTNNTKSHIYTTFSHTPVGGTSAGAGFNKVRLTFGDFTHGYSGTMFRISQIGVYNYGSSGVRNTYMSRGLDDPIFRHITPNATTTYDLGSSSKIWRYIYSKYLALTTATQTFAIGDHTQSSIKNAGIRVNDIRNASLLNNSLDTAANFFFTNSGTPDSTWWSILHVKGWTGGYAAWELAGTAHNADHRTKALYVRTGNTSNAWGSWRKIYDESNKPTRSELGLGTAADADLSASTSSSSTTTAATSSAVKAAYDLANSANTTAGNALSAATGALIFRITYSISNGTVTGAAHVYSGGQEITSTLQDSQFAWSYCIGTGSWVSLGTGKTKAVTISTLGLGGKLKCDFTES